MATKIIVSYDGTENDRDALALGRMFKDAGASLALAYVRHSKELGGREALAEHEAQELLDGGAEWLGDPQVPRYVVLDASTPQGLRELAVGEQASAIVFGSAYRTTPGHVDPQASASRLMEGGSLAIGIAPAGFHDSAPSGSMIAIAAVDEEEDTSAQQTAEGLASKFGATVTKRASDDVGLLIIGSKAPAVQGSVLISAASSYLIDLARCPALVLRRGVPLTF
jgi:nucleotide-binding universal stress UspA family protein